MKVGSKTNRFDGRREGVDILRSGQRRLFTILEAFCRLKHDSLSDRPEGLVDPSDGLNGPYCEHAQCGSA